jgi:hypothetical protein
MIGIPKTNSLPRAIISGVCHEGLSVTTIDGRPCKLAIIDDNGKIIDEGPTVAREAWNVTLAVYKKFLIGQGHLRILSTPLPEGVPQTRTAA